MEVILFTQGVGPSVDTLDIETGSALSTMVTVTHDTANTEGTRITMRSVSAVPADFRGIELKPGDPMVLFARPQPSLTAKCRREGNDEERATTAGAAAGCTR